MFHIGVYPVLDSTPQKYRGSVTSVLREVYGWVTFKGLENKPSNRWIV
jgi:hypothetical protein